MTRILAKYIPNQNFVTARKLGRLDFVLVDAKNKTREFLQKQEARNTLINTLKDNKLIDLLNKPKLFHVYIFLINSQKFYHSKGLHLTINRNRLHERYLKYWDGKPDSNLGLTQFRKYLAELIKLGLLTRYQTKYSRGDRTYSYLIDISTIKSMVGNYRCIIWEIGKNLGIFTQRKKKWPIDNKKKEENNTDCTVYTYLKLTRQNWNVFLQQHFCNDNREKIMLRTKIPSNWQPNDGTRRYLAEDLGMSTSLIEAATKKFSTNHKIKGTESDDWDHYFIQYCKQAMNNNWILELSGKKAKSSTRDGAIREEEINTWQTQALAILETIEPQTPLDEFKKHLATLDDKIMAASLITNITDIFVGNSTLYLFESRNFLNCQKYEGRLEKYAANWYNMKFVSVRNIKEKDQIIADYNKYSAVTDNSDVEFTLDLSSFVKTI